MINNINNIYIELAIMNFNKRWTRCISDYEFKETKYTYITSDYEMHRHKKVRFTYINALTRSTTCTASVIVNFRIRRPESISVNELCLRYLHTALVQYEFCVQK